MNESAGEDGTGEEDNGGGRHSECRPNLETNHNGLVTVKIENLSGLDKRSDRSDINIRIFAI